MLTSTATQLEWIRGATRGEFVHGARKRPSLADDGRHPHRKKKQLTGEKKQGKTTRFHKLDAPPSKALTRWPPRCWRCPWTVRIEIGIRVGERQQGEEEETFNKKLATPQVASIRSLSLSLSLSTPFDLLRRRRWRRRLRWGLFSFFPSLLLSALSLSLLLPPPLPLLLAHASPPSRK